MKRCPSRSGTFKNKTYRRRAVPTPVNPMPRIRGRAMLSQGELAFFHALRRAIAGRCSISIKTRLADIVHCPVSHWRKSFGRKIAQKHVDFVLWDSFRGAILAVIELDDRTHDRPERQKRDEFLDDTLCRAKIRLIRVRAASEYQVAELDGVLAQVLTAKS